MQIRPILSTLRRHQLTAVLLMLQVAFTCAIVCNVAFMIVQRVQRVTVPSGLDESAVSMINVDDLQPGANLLSLHQAGLAALRRVPWVQSAAIVSNVPLSGNEDASGLCASLDALHAAIKARSTHAPGCAEPDEYMGGTDVLRTLGLKLVAGRDFRADEYVSGNPDQPQDDTADSVIISRALARRLYPAGHAVGHSLYIGESGFHGKGTRIVGVVEHLQRGALQKIMKRDLSILLPIVPGMGNVHFVLRSKPAERKRVMRAAVALLNKRVPARHVSASDAQTYTQIRADYFQRDTTMIGMLLASALGLLFVTALGITGLATFWVQQRTRSIGIRRAVGATRGDILRYFQTENFLIVTGGIVLGVLLAVGLNLLLMKHYELSRLPLWYLPVGAVALWLLGQLAVLAPALRAARVPPVVATRSV